MESNMLEENTAESLPFAREIVEDSDGSDSDEVSIGSQQRHITASAEDNQDDPTSFNEEVLREEFGRYSFLRPMKKYLPRCLRALRERDRLIDVHLADGDGAPLPKNTIKKKKSKKHSHSETTNDDNEMQVSNQPFDSENDNVSKTTDYMDTMDTATVHAAPEFSVGDIVEVERRMGPGMNKPGGVARIMAIHQCQSNQSDHNMNKHEMNDNNNTNGTDNKKKSSSIYYVYDVRYTVVGGSERRVDEKYLTPTAITSASGPRSKIGRCKVCKELYRLHNIYRTYKT